MKNLNNILNKIKYEDLLEQYNYDFKKLSEVVDLNEESFFEFYEKELDWFNISMREDLTSEFISKFENNLSMEFIFITNPNLFLKSTDLTKKYEDIMEMNKPFKKYYRC